MGLVPALSAATAGNLVGSLIAYGIGATGLAGRIPGARAVLARWGASLDERGSLAVFTARLLPLARTFVSLPAGARRVPMARFIALTAAGCGLWALAFILAGMASGSAWSAVSSLAGKVLLAGGAVVLLWNAPPPPAGGARRISRRRR